MPLANVWLLVIISTFFWGTNFNAAQALAGEVAPLTAAAERFFIALVIFSAMRLYTGRAESQIGVGDMARMIPLGILGVFGFNYAFFTALHTTTALNGALIMALSPMVSTQLSVWMLGTRISRAQYAGMVFAFMGVALVVTAGHFTQLKVATGDFWMLLACLVWSLYSVGSKRFAPHIPSMQFARWTVSTGAISLMLAALLLENPLRDIPQLPVHSHVILLYMGVCGSVLAYIYWLKGVQQLGPDKSAIAFNLVPVFTLLASLVMGVIPGIFQIIGLLLVFVGVALFTGWRPKRKIPQ
ncbi:MAG: DMT family transporter [Oceanospirillaceae bacterium]|nr:DMT family transporter [Oceanospirillaceae bacterium]MCP5349401.1 DMT family transporter [Oceanospirillaceae bacterium]